MTATADQDAYPAPVHTAYGRRAWMLGEEADEGAMAEGHGPRALAAISALIRGENGDNEAVRDQDFTELWVRFHETCGCTPEQHAEHLARIGDNDDLDGCPCGLWGLPPCDSRRFEWRYEIAAEGQSGALPVTQVIW